VLSVVTFLWSDLFNFSPFFQEIGGRSRLIEAFMTCVFHVLPHRTLVLSFEIKFGALKNSNIN
jgi:hypothetical protein